MLSVSPLRLIALHSCPMCLMTDLRFGFHLMRGLVCLCNITLSLVCRDQISKILRESFEAHIDRHSEIKRTVVKMTLQTNAPHPDPTQRCL